MSAYIESVLKQWQSYKMVAEKTFDQLEDQQLLWQPHEESNSIATIVKHMHGNMLSRWTDFLDSDGEKDWRKRDEEFENDVQSRQEMLTIWEEGWKCTFDAVKNLTDDDLTKEIHIRHEAHTVLDAIQRQLAHYPYHIGQIVFVGKLIVGEDWTTLSIAKGKSQEFLTKMEQKNVTNKT